MATLADLIDHFAATQRLIRSAASRGTADADAATNAHMAARRALFERLGLLVGLRDRLMAYDLNMGMSGPGCDSRPPTGEDYNHVMDDVRATLTALIGSEAPQLEEVAYL